MANIGNKIILRFFNTSTIEQLTGWVYDISDEFRAYGESIQLLTPTSGTFTPEIADASTGGNVGTATTIEGVYNQIGDRVFIDISLQSINTTGMTSGNVLYIRNLPYSVDSVSFGSVHFNNVALFGADGYSSKAVTDNTIVITYPNSAGFEGFIKIGDIGLVQADIWISISYQIGD